MISGRDPIPLLQNQIGEKYIQNRHQFTKHMLDKLNVPLSQTNGPPVTIVLLSCRLTKYVFVLTS